MCSNALSEMAYALYCLIGGDGPEDAYALLHAYGFTNENGEWVYVEDEE